MARRLVSAGSGSSSSSWPGNPGTRTRITPPAPAPVKETDRPIAGLLTDLKQRSLLKQTLVVWGGEFGRTPGTQGKDGRDHHPYGFSIWLAGGGIQGGQTYGATDDFGYHAVADRCHVSDLHATILHLLGLDFERLTFPRNGHNERLTDVHPAKVLMRLLA